MIALDENEDGFSIAKNRITFNELSTILEKMHETAVHILNNK